MQRFAVLFLVVVTGCSTSTTPHAAKNKEDTSGIKPVPVENKSKPDYAGWSYYVPTEPRLEVRFPREPSVKPATSATGNFHVAVVQRQAADDLGFVCQWIIKEEALSSKEDEASYLRGVQQGHKGILVEEMEITLYGVPGREFVTEIAERNFVRCRVYVADKRVVNLQVWGKDTEAVSSKDAVKFLESLTINK